MQGAAYRLGPIKTKWGFKKGLVQEAATGAQMKSFRLDVENEITKRLQAPAEAIKKATAK